MASLTRNGAPRISTAVYNSLASSNLLVVKPKHDVQSLEDKVANPTHSQGLRAGFGAYGGILNGGLRATKVAVSRAQIRLAHTDLQYPDFDDYRRDCTKDPRKPTHLTDDRRRAWTYGMYGAAGVVGMYMGKMAAQSMVMYKGMAKDVLAAALIEVNVSDIPEGVSKTFEWRGKPVFVFHRSADEVEKVREVPLTGLRHPEKDEDRTKKDDWLVVIGVCTHLGCVPIANSGDFGGYYCPCHGSHYDASARIRQGPAPLNLEVPEYYFKTDDLLVIGTDSE